MLKIIFFFKKTSIFPRLPLFARSLEEIIDRGGNGLTRVCLTHLQIQSCWRFISQLQQSKVYGWAVQWVLRALITWESMARLRIPI